MDRDVVAPPVTENGLDDVIDNGVEQRVLVLVPLGSVLCRDDDGVDARRRQAVVLDGDLALRVGTQMRNRVRLAHLGLARDEPMGEIDRQRHERLRLATCETEHEPLVAGALLLVQTGSLGDALCDVGALLIERDQDGTAPSVESLRRIVVADAGHRLAHDLGNVDIPVARDLAGDNGHAGRHHRLARNARVRIHGDHRVENGVGNLVGQLVRVAHRHGLGREEVAAAGHLRRPFATE